MPPRSIHFVTCVNDSLKYDSCRASIESLRPEGLQVSADVIENMDGRYSSAAALNLGRERSRADLIVFCHQDVVFPEEWLALLLASIEQVALRDDPWAVIGPMGRVGKRYFGHALGSDGKATFHGPLPEQVETLDEFCLVVPAGLSLRFDERLGGHHLYGVDLCLAALEAGKAAYAIDAPCQHNSSTRHRPPEYHTIKRRLQRKWMFARRKVGRSVGTTCGRIRFGLFEGWI